MRRPILLGVVTLSLACAKPTDDGQVDATSGVTTSESGDADGADADGADADADGTAGDGDGDTAGDGDGDTAGDGDGDTAGDGDGDGGPKFDLGMPEDLPAPELVPVKDLPNLESITFYERTGGVAPDPFTFLVGGLELTVRLADPLAIGNFDIDGATGEFYDVYYSDEDGQFQLDGSYLTISGTFGAALPAGGGLNLAEIGLNFSDQSVEYGNYVASFVALGDNAAPQNVDLAIDGDLQTHTTMGNTVGQMDRLRVTLGFESTSGPPK
jgi:hypothetical protein